MKLENQLTSLEPSKRLKELGVKQDSAFYWILEKEDGTEKEKMLNNRKIPSWNGKKMYNYSAFSAVELADMLPNKITYKNHELFFFIEKIDRFYVCSYCDEIHEEPEAFSEEKLADVMAKMLIYLIENNYLKKGDLK